MSVQGICLLTIAVLKAKPTNELSTEHLTLIKFDNSFSVRVVVTAFWVQNW